MTRPSAKQRSAKKRSGLSAYVIGQKAPAGALRLGVVRRPPRGVRRENYGPYFDLWLPLLAPSPSLLSWWHEGEPSDERFRAYTKRFHREMATSDKRSAIALLAALSKRTPISLGCYCDRPQCHRFLLERLIGDAATLRD